MIINKYTVGNYESDSTIIRSLNTKFVRMTIKFLRQHYFLM